MVSLFSGFGCNSPIYRDITTANMDMTSAGSKIIQGAQSITQSSELTQRIANEGAKTTKEPMSKEKFNTIGLIQEQYIQPQAAALEDEGDFIIDKNKGQIKVKFTFKVLGILFLILSVIAVLSYFGLGGFVRKAIGMALSPVEAMMSDVADTVAKQAYHSEIDNSKFPKNIRMRMKNREEVDEPVIKVVTPTDQK